MSLMLYARASRNGFGFSPSSNCPNSTEALGDNFYHLYKN
uniref:Uncharacterized protein n=1 Tax=Romanomermis culicivorax TaxID=13658 RepID=A0A915ISB8_ROMCU